MLEVFSYLTNQLVRSSGVGDRERWIITLRMAGHCGSGYAFGNHGKQAGDKVAKTALAEPQQPGIGPRDRALLELVDQLYETNQLDDELWERLTLLWPSDELVELVTLAGFYWMVASLANSLHVHDSES
jgi:4-carboxymuconolactone decarboxylase